MTVTRTESAKLRRTAEKEEEKEEVVESIFA